MTSCYELEFAPGDEGDECPTHRRPGILTSSAASTSAATVNDSAHATSIVNLNNLVENLLPDMKEDDTVPPPSTIEENLVVIPTTPLYLDITLDAQVHLDIVSDTQLHVDAGTFFVVRLVQDKLHLCCGSITMTSSPLVLPQASLTRATASKFVLDPGLASVAAMTITVQPSSVNANAPAKCSTKCPSYDIDDVALAAVYGFSKDPVSDPDYASATSTIITVAPSYINTDAHTMCSMGYLNVNSSGGDAAAALLLFRGAVQGRPSTNGDIGGFTSWYLTQDPASPSSTRSKPTTIAKLHQPTKQSPIASTP